MSNKVTFVVMLWVILTFVSGVCEMEYVGTSEISRLQVLMTAPTFTETASVLGVVTSFVDFAWDWFVNLFGILTWDFAFFQGQWQIVKYIMFIPVSIGLIAAIVAMIRGTNA